MISSTLCLDIKIVGGGIAGLVTALAICRQHQGHRVTVYEGGSGLSELGAGIQMWPNVTRVFRSWGLEAEFEELSNKPKAMRLARYEDDSTIADIPCNPMGGWMFDSLPIYQLARPDIQRIFAEACYREGGEYFRIVFDKAARLVDVEDGIIYFEDGTTESADLVVGADGIRSACRGSMPGCESIKPRAFQEYWFRATVDRDVMLKQDPSIAALMEPNQFSMAWAGPGVAVLGYPIFQATKYNLVVMAPRPASEEDLGKWNAEGDVAEVARVLDPFNERIRKLWSLVSSCRKWTVGDVTKIPSYSSVSGKTILIGDAAHAIIPHAGAGGALAIEDAAALGVFISHARSTSDLSRLMPAWSALRQARVENTRRNAADSAVWLNHADGPEQQKRDRSWSGLCAGMWEAIEKYGEEGFKRMPKPPQNPDGTDANDPGWRQYLYGYDAEEEAEKVIDAALAG